MPHDDPPSVRDLRRRWKPHKERLSQERPDHPNPIRFHRACSWLQQAEEMTTAELLDALLVHQWVAFNSLYGVWDGTVGIPTTDQVSWKQFLSRLLTLDADRALAGLLQDHKPLVLSLLEDEYLDRLFWSDPSPQTARRAKRWRQEALTWYLEGRWGLVLERVLDRVYLLRCQLVHGAATCGGRLNRTPVRRATLFLARFLPAMLQVWIDHGSDLDWGPMCYPPLDYRSPTAPR